MCAGRGPDLDLDLPFPFPISNLWVPSRQENREQKNQHIQILYFYIYLKFVVPSYHSHIVENEILSLGRLLFILVILFLVFVL